MNFDVVKEKITSSHLNMEFFHVPWDSEVFNRNVAQISKFEIKNSKELIKDFSFYQKWCAQKKIDFSSCRLLHSQMNEGFFLETQGFRFIELNYQPVLNNLEKFDFPVSSIDISLAESSDQETLANVAETLFNNERFHQDPQIETNLAHKRYRIWLENAFKQNHQTVLKCILNQEIVAFFVVEYPEPNHCFWSLVGMLPKYQGKGLGKIVWQAMLKYHQQELVKTVSTSISSHNVAVFNLYVALGFRFPEPYTTFHWTKNNI